MHYCQQWFSVLGEDWTARQLPTSSSCWGWRSCTRQHCSPTTSSARTSTPNTTFIRRHCCMAGILIPGRLQHGYWVVSDCPCHYQITAHSRLLHLQGDFPVPLCFCSRHPLPDIQKGVPRQGCVSGLCTDRDSCQHTYWR